MESISNNQHKEAVFVAEKEMDEVRGRGRGTGTKTADSGQNRIQEDDGGTVRVSLVYGGAFFVSNSADPGEYH